MEFSLRAPLVTILTVRINTEELPKKHFNLLKKYITGKKFDIVYFIYVTYNIV